MVGISIAGFIYQRVKINSIIHVLLSTELSLVCDVVTMLKSLIRDGRLLN